VAELRWRKVRRRRRRDGEGKRLGISGAGSSHASGSPGDSFEVMRCTTKSDIDESSDYGLLQRFFVNDKFVRRSSTT